MADNVKPMQRDPLKLNLKIAKSEHARGRVENVTMTYAQVLERAKHPYRDLLTLEQFTKLTPDQQAKRKHGPYFVGGQFDHGIRQAAYAKGKWLVSLDIDEAPPGILQDLRDGFSGLGACEYFVYSTRKHSAAAPRLRVGIPLAKELAASAYVALTRILGQRIDASMRAVDHVSYRVTQYMYWPSVCADSEFVFFRHEGLVLDPLKVLENWEEETGKKWTVETDLPYSEREPKGRRAGTKIVDARTKKGPVGIFCRTYTIHEAIEKWLPEVYAPSERDSSGTPTRYSYLPGSGSNGAVVYDDNTQLYSNHGTDPCFLESCNAFDLVRLHLYMDLDKGEDLEGNTKPQNMPSYEKMVEIINDDPECAREGVYDRYGRDDDVVFDDLPLSDDEPDDEDWSVSQLDDLSVPEPKRQRSVHEITRADWREKLQRSSAAGPVTPNLPNLALILKFAPAFEGVFRYDEFVNEVVAVKKLRFPELGITVDGRTPADPLGRLNDKHVDVVRTVLAAPAGKGRLGWDLRYGVEDVRQAIRVAAAASPFHPVREWLTGLVWDGVPRVEQLWIKGCHTPDTRYYRDTARLTIIAACARIMEPGCKFDYAPILEGKQGTRKTTFVKSLGGKWAGETEGHFDDQKAFVEATQGFWIIEIPELVPLGGKTETNSAKSSMSRQREHVRMSYGHYATTFARQFIFIGTTNEKQYLRDQTGNRRYWPIACGDRAMDIAWVQKWRSQIFAEGMAMYREMRRQTNGPDLPLYLVDDAEALVQQEARVTDDTVASIAGMIQAWLDTPVPLSQSYVGGIADDSDPDSEKEPKVLRRATCVQELAERVMNTPRDRVSRRMTLDIGAAMHKLEGWELRGMSGRSTPNYGAQRLWQRVKTEDDDL